MITINCHCRVPFYIILIFLASCVKQKGINETLVKVTPVKYSLQLDSAFQGENISWSRIKMKIPSRPAVSGTITDSTYVIKYADSSYISIVREGNTSILQLFHQQARSNPELREMLEEKQFETDFELLKYIYGRKPGDDLPWEDMILETKQLIMVNGSEKGIREITGPDLKGFQYCIGDCKFITYDMYLENYSYKIFSSEVDQNVLIKMISTFEINRKAITP